MLAALVSVVVVLVVVAVSFRGGWARTMDLTLHADRSGLVLEPGAMVMRHGVRIGTVASVHPDGDGARIELELDREYSSALPSDTTADITSSTLFGGKRVVLSDDDDDDEGRASTAVLASGDALRAESVTTETQTVFQSLTEVMVAVQPEKAAAVTGALAQGARGRGEEIGQATVALSEFTGAVTPELGSLRRDLRAGAAAADGLAAATPDLVSALGGLRVPARTLTDQAATLDVLLPAIAGVAIEGNALLDPHEQEIADAVGYLRPTAELLKYYAPAIPCFFRGADRARQLAEPASGANGYSMVLNSTLLLGVDPYRYPDDLPVVRAGGGPRCGELPVRTPEDGNADYLVADVGMNPFERGNTSPEFDAAPLWVLLTEGMG
ncbi:MULTISPECIES: MCE family protein [Dietzia]|uniref:MCE family protein n=1 Tax=Dietzia TaxID=37914 RepID=UPI0021185434|nr:MULTISPECIES: MCE family protein [Dietzia]MCT1434829.1 MCE family protein [Dietzia maris]